LKAPTAAAQNEDRAEHQIVAAPKNMARNEPSPCLADQLSVGQIEQMEYQADNPQKYGDAETNVETHQAATRATDKGNPEDEESAEERQHDKDNNPARDRLRVELLTAGIDELRIH
jgi:TATA-binding protein-associated factor Taf7